MRFHFSSFKSPNVQSLDGFQPCFHSLKSETKPLLASLTAVRFHWLCPLRPSVVSFVQPSPCPWNPVRVEPIQAHRDGDSEGVGSKTVYWCMGSLKYTLQKEPQGKLCEGLNHGGFGPCRHRTLSSPFSSSVEHLDPESKHSSRACFVS